MMTALEFIAAKKAAVEAYGKHLDDEVTRNHEDKFTGLLKVACIDAFELGFDCAFKACQEKEEV